MPKKQKPKKFEQIIIHPNRWLIWVIALSLIAGVGVLGYIKLSEEYFESQTTRVYEQSSWRTYKNSELGFAISYPSSWSIEGQNNTILFEPPDFDQGVAVSVEKTSSEKAIRASLNNVLEQAITLDGVAGSAIVNKLSNTLTEKVVLAKANNHLYVIRSGNNLFDQILLTFTFITSQGK